MQTGTSSAGSGFADVQIIYTPSKLEDLLDLIEPFLSGVTDTSAFRREFVIRFLGRSLGDPVDTIAMLIEVAWVDFDTSESIDREELEQRIFDIAATAEACNSPRKRSERRFAKTTERAGAQ